MQHYESEFSLDLRAHCSAILVFRLLRVLRKMVGFCRCHLSAQVEIENVVYEIHGNELACSMPIHQFLKVSFHSMTNCCSESESCCHRHFRNRILVVPNTRSLQHGKTLCATQQVFRSEIGAHSFHHNLGIAKVHHQERCRHWLFDTTVHPLLLLDRSSMDMCLLRLLCQRFILTHSNCFGRLMAARSKLPRENMLAELSYI